MKLVVLLEIQLHRSVDNIHLHIQLVIPMFILKHQFINNKKY